MEINSHHAQYIMGDRSRLDGAVVESVLEAFDIEREMNPDFFYKVYDSFGIDDARTVKVLNENRPLTDRRVFVLSVGKMTVEAQNALLKILEEPEEKTYFIFIFSEGEMLLDTLRSRMLKIDGASIVRSDEAGKFIKQDYSGRINFVKSFIDQSHDGIREQTFNFLSEIERELDRFSDFGKLECVLKAKRDIKLKSSSPKMILENLALTL